MRLPEGGSQCYVCGLEKEEANARPRWFVCGDCLRASRKLGVLLEMVDLSGLLYRVQMQEHG